MLNIWIYLLVMLKGKLKTTTKKLLYVPLVAENKRYV